MSIKPIHKNAVIVGATSGIGYEVALLLLQDGWKIGIAGRRKEKLEALKALYPDNIYTCPLDVRKPGSEKALETLIGDMGDMDLFLLSSGIGFQNYALNPEIELNTLETNGTGFARMTGFAFRYFLKRGKGHLAVISSIAGTKGLGIAPAYSATKRFQNIYLDALEQLACMHRVPIHLRISVLVLWQQDYSTTTSIIHC